MAKKMNSLKSLLTFSKKEDQSGKVTRRVRVRGNVGDVDRSTQGAALSGQPNISLDSPVQPEVGSLEHASVADDQPSGTTTSMEHTTMTLTFRSLSKNGRAAIYSGAIQPLRFSLSVFPNKAYPETIEMLDGILVPGRTPKAKLTPEQKEAAKAAAKLAKANKPKPTLAEKAAQAQRRLDALNAKLAEQSAM